MMMYSIKRLAQEYNTETLVCAGTQTVQSEVPPIDNSCYVLFTVYSRLNIPCQHFSQATYAQCLMLHSRHHISDNLSEITNKQTIYMYGSKYCTVANDGKSVLLISHKIFSILHESGILSMGTKTSCDVYYVCAG